MSMFAEPKACLAFIESLRWPNGFICPSCGQKGDPWRQSRGRLVCPKCRHQGSVTAGTILEKTRTPLLIWFKVAWYLASASKAIPVRDLGNKLGIRYRAAWEMLQRFRVAMGDDNRSRLEGTVLVEVITVRTVETLKSPVLIFVEVTDRKGWGKIRMNHLQGLSDEFVVSGIRDTITAGSSVILEGQSYGDKLKSLGYAHQKSFSVQTGDPSERSKQVAYKHSFLLRQSIPHMVRDNYLQSYLDEVVYMFNHKATHPSGLLFRKLLLQVLALPGRARLG